MEWLTFIDPTALCVLGLILALTLLWGYVMVSGRKKEQPDLSLLYESTSGPKTGSGLAKKTSKTKPKKQSDSTPRVSSKPQQLETQAESDSPRAPVKTNKTAVKAKDSTAKASLDLVSKVKVRKVRGAPSRGSEEETKKDQSETEEGEWQTQLSRQQLRALRHKKRQEGDRSSSDSEPTKTEKTSSSTEEPSEDNSKNEKEASVPSSTPAEKTSYSKGGRRGKSGTKKQRATPVASSNDSVDSPKDGDRDTTKTEEEPAVDTVSVAPTLPSTTGDPPVANLDQRLPSPSSLEETGLTEVEQALKEAALSGSSSPEFVETGGGKSELPEVKPKRQKKSRQKNNEDSNDSSSPDIPSSKAQPAATEQEHDDWVVIN